MKRQCQAPLKFSHPEKGVVAGTLYCVDDRDHDGQHTYLISEDERHDLVLAPATPSDQRSSAHPEP